MRAAVSLAIARCDHRYETFLIIDAPENKLERLSTANHFQPRLMFAGKVGAYQYSEGRHDIQHNDIQHNDTQHIDTWLYNIEMRHRARRLQYDGT